jgi:TonB family protein
MRAIVAVLAMLLVVATTFASPPPVSLRDRVYPVDDDIVLHRPRIDYPVIARERRIQGRGFYLLFVPLTTGAVREVKTERSTGSPILDAAAIEYLGKWRFKPALLRLLEKRHGPSGSHGEIIVGVPMIFRL